jgi:hypothetical protein
MNKKIIGIIGLIVVVLVVLSVSYLAPKPKLVIKNLSITKEDQVDWRDNSSFWCYSDVGFLVINEGNAEAVEAYSICELYEHEGLVDSDETRFGYLPPGEEYPIHFWKHFKRVKCNDTRVDCSVNCKNCGVIP